MFELMAGVTPALAMRDTQAMLEFVDGQPEANATALGGKSILRTNAAASVAPISTATLRTSSQRSAGDLDMALLLHHIHSPPPAAVPIPVPSGRAGWDFIRLRLKRANL